MIFLSCVWQGRAVRRHAADRAFVLRIEPLSRPLRASIPPACALRAPKAFVVAARARLVVENRMRISERFFSGLPALRSHPCADMPGSRGKAHESRQTRCAGRRPTVCSPSAARRTTRPASVMPRAPV